jgi:hypothetical protein
MRSIRSFLSCATLLAFSVAGTAPLRAETPAEWGGYLVNTIMTCQNCHTPMGPNGPQFDKALSGGLTFDEAPFKVTASNITPDRKTGIGAWTDAEIKAALRTGIRPNGVPMAPIMPTGFYGILTDADMDAIVAYLRSVPAVESAVPGPVYRFPAPRQVFPGAEAPAAASADPVQRGFYLATIGHCMECHTKMVRGSRDWAADGGAGGMEFPGPWGVSVAANITADPEKGLGRWTDAEVKRAIAQGVSRDGHRLKPPMGYPYYARMTDADLDALVAWLRTVPARP